MAIGYKYNREAILKLFVNIQWRTLFSLHSLWGDMLGLNLTAMEAVHYLNYVHYMYTVHYNYQWRHGMVATY